MADIATLPERVITEELLLRLAREVALDIVRLPDLLEKHGVSAALWERIQALPRFQMLVSEYATAWISAQNTPERVKLKSAAMLEEALEEMHNRVHDQREPLSAKTEMLKLISRLAGIGGERIEGQLAEKFTLNINIGDGGTHQISATTAKIIEHET